MSGPRRHLAFLPYPAYGHMVPVLPVIAELVARGHRVTCFASEDFVGRVADTGARVARYQPALSADPPPDSIDADECARASLKLLNASTAILPAIETAFDGDRPDAVAYDTTLWLSGRLLAARWGRPSIQLSATFVSNDHFSLSDQHQDFAGRIDPGHPALAEFAARLTAVVTGSGLGADRQAELFHGREEFTVAFLPRQFQFDADTFDARHAFVGPTLPDRPGTAWAPPAGDRPVLLVSLGTTVNNQPGFFRTCVAAFADLPWHTVLALGGRIDPADLGPLPSNVEAHAWVPVDAVLAHASVFLCQCGMGSVMQALHAGVPLVVVPHHPEQHVNARRLTELGLAQVVQRADATPPALRAAVLAVAQDSGLRERVARMRGHVRAAGGASAAADAIEARLSTVEVK